MRILQRLGCEIVPFDTTRWVSGGKRLSRFLAHRLNSGHSVVSMNRALQLFGSSLNSISHIWIDKGRWIYPDTLFDLKRSTSATLVHYTPDPQLLLHRSRHFNVCIPLYDLLVTTKSYEMKRYKALGAKSILLVLQGYDDRFYPVIPTPVTKAELESDICFIGHCERHYARRLRVTESIGKRLKIWGPGWKRYSFFNSWAHGHVAGDGIWGKHYPLALASSKIGLGLLSKRVPETTTTRSFEIPAMGLFLLAERTAEHLELFQEGVEAEFFSNDEELRDKIIYYIGNDSAREKISHAGYKRCLASGYQSQKQLRKVLKQIV
ncbi:MAG: hypothetical protein C5B60_06750 [Chloroflexi bacterium]|nr:MAG: hypothetical protein C5B60_06750 [Chloroflexota bacterium]